MTVDQLKIIVAANDVDKLIETFKGLRIVKDTEAAISQYNPKLHKVLTDKTFRPDKQLKDNNGNVTRVIPVSRLTLAYQKKITLTSAGFLGTPEIDCLPVDEGQKNMLTLIEKVWDDNKLDYKFLTIAKTVMSEKECAEIWFMQDAEIAKPAAGIVGYWDGYPIAPTSKYKLGMKLLANSLGDSLYPVFDEYGDMIAFGRGYKTVSAEGKDVENFDVYTADQIIKHSKETGSWVAVPQTNVMKKIPVIYYSQPLTEWDDVQELIERMEIKKSNQADTNDYTDQPILVGKGDTITLPDKHEQGKYVELKGQDADLKYLALPGAPEAMKLEMEGLSKDIHSMTHTPDISFENVRGLGVFSGIALKMLFMDAHLKAKDKVEIFGEGLQRRLNFIKRALSVIDAALIKSLTIKIKPKFEFFLPQNVQEEMQILVAAVAGGIMTWETAVRLNPLIINAQEEIDAIKEAIEAAATAKKAEGATGGPGQSGNAVVDQLGKIPLALQQLTLGASRAAEMGNQALADKLNAKVTELLETI